MEGLERLEKETFEMNNVSVTAVFEYLKTRKDLYEKFNNREKTMEGMYDYLYNKSKPMKQGNVAMVPDNLVYIWAVTYFSKSNEELGIKTKNVMPTSADKVIEKINKKHNEKEKQKENEQPQNTDNQISMFKEEQK